MAYKSKERKVAAEKNSSLFPPVVSVLGHVDHGKTTLLDAIRQSHIAQREHGGITQKIGASSVEIIHEGVKRKITFIDTPGHEAFSLMRSRGAQVADVGLLIVSVVDGVMPQTKESIQLLLTSKVPYIVVLTKADLPDKRAEKVKQQLLKEGVSLEGYGGDVPVIEVSAKTGLHMKELLELILLVYDLHQELRTDLSEIGPLKAVIVESRLDKKSGPRASVVIKNGTLSIRDEIVCDGMRSKVRSLSTDTVAQIQKATIGQAVEVLGFGEVPKVGAVVQRSSETKGTFSSSGKPASLSYSPTIEKEKLAVILCADTQGSLEAITYSLPEKVYVVAAKTGEVTEGDVLHAKSTGAIILSFNSKIRIEILKLAQIERVLLKNYTIIYELLDEIREALEGKELAMEEQIFGTAKVLARFPFEKTFVLGIKVLDGRVARGDRVRLVRGEEVLGESTVTSLHHGKDSISKIEKGQEAGIILFPFLDFEIGDMVICHG